MSWQRVIPVEEVLKQLAFYYPIILELYPAEPDVNECNASFRCYGYMYVDLDMDVEKIINGDEP